jgi:hypothetical protein
MTELNKPLDVKLAFPLWKAILTILFGVIIWFTHRLMDSPSTHGKCLPFLPPLSLPSFLRCSRWGR